MHARLTRYKIKPGHIDEARTLVNEIGSAGIDGAGVFQLIHLGGEDGAGVLIAIYQSKEDADRIAGRAKEAWAQFMHFLEAPPESEEFDVLAYDIAAAAQS